MGECFPLLFQFLFSMRMEETQHFARVDTEAAKQYEDGIV